MKQGKGFLINSSWIAAAIFLGLSGCGGEKSGDTTEGLELVYIDNGAIQCESAGMTVTETAKLLTDEGIDVITSHCGHLTGISFPSQCGLGSAAINLHRINSQNVVDAKELGFSPVSSLKDHPDLGYEVIDCPTES